MIERSRIARKTEKNTKEYGSDLKDVHIKGMVHVDGFIMTPECQNGSTGCLSQQAVFCPNVEEFSTFRLIQIWSDGCVCASASELLSSPSLGASHRGRGTCDPASRTV